MADVDIDELKKMSPERRLHALRELEEKSRKEIEEARKLMAESEREIEVKEELERDMPIPQLAAVDIDSLFSPEEKDIFRMKRFSGEARKAEADEEVAAKGKNRGEAGEARPAEKKDFLEEMIRADKTPQLGEQEAHQYGARLEMIRDRVYELRDMTDNDPGRFKRYEAQYKEELEQMKNEMEGIHEKYKTAGDAVVQESTIGNQIDKLLSWYRT